MTYFTVSTRELLARVQLGLQYRDKLVPVLLHPPQFPTDLPQFQTWLHLIADKRARRNALCTVRLTR
jgi:hypothetical protein